MFHISAVSDILGDDSLAQWLEHMIQCIISVKSLTYCVKASTLKALDLYPGGPGSNPIRGVGYFQTIHCVFVTNFHIRKMGAPWKWTN